MIAAIVVLALVASSQAIQLNCMEKVVVENLTSDRGQPDYVSEPVLSKLLGDIRLCANDATSVPNCISELIKAQIRSTAAQEVLLGRVSDFVKCLA